MRRTLVLQQQQQQACIYVGVHAAAAADRVIGSTQRPRFDGNTFDTFNEARGVDPLQFVVVPMRTYVEVSSLRVRSMLLYG